MNWSNNCLSFICVAKNSMRRRLKHRRHRLHRTQHHSQECNFYKLQRLLCQVNAFISSTFSWKSNRYAKQESSSSRMHDRNEPNAIHHAVGGADSPAFDCTNIFLFVCLLASAGMQFTNWAMVSSRNLDAL